VGAAAAAAARRLLRLGRVELELAYVNGDGLRGCGNFLDDRAQAEKDDQRENGSIDDGRGSDGPGVGLDGHAIGNRDGRRRQLEGWKLDGEKDVADALIEPGPDGLFFKSLP